MVYSQILHMDLCLWLSQIESEQRFSPMFAFWSLITLDFIFSLRVYLFIMWGKSWGFLPCDYTVILAQLIENIIFPH